MLFARIVLVKNVDQCRLSEMFSKLPLYHLAGPFFLLMYLVQQYLILPLERLITSDQALLASYLFLPAGAKVVVFYISRWKSLPSLFVALLVCYWAFYLPSGSSLWLLVLLSAVSTLALPLMYLVACHGFGLDLFKDRRGGPHWFALLSLVGLGSLLNGWGMNYAWNSAPDPSLMLRFAAGDIAGTAALMTLAMFVMRRLRLRA